MKAYHWFTHTNLIGKRLLAPDDQLKTLELPLTDDVKMLPLYLVVYFENVKQEDYLDLAIIVIGDGDEVWLADVPLRYPVHDGTVGPCYAEIPVLAPYPKRHVDVLLKNRSTGGKFQWCLPVRRVERPLGLA